jgi:hypothetical protein
MSVSPADIHLWWRQLAERDAYDTALDDLSFAEFLAADAALGPEIEKAIDSLEALRATRPEFFTRYDYDFAFDRSLYRAAMEPSFQLRLLEALTELHAFFTAQGAEVPGHLSGIVVRRTWEMSAFAARPLTPPPQRGVPVRFVVAPLGFVESAALAFRALLSDEPQPVVKAIISVHLAAMLRPDLDPVSLRGVQRRILRSAPFFATAFNYVDGYSPSSLEGAWAFALLDFVMFHEVGHIFYRDTSDSSNQAGAEDRANQFAVDLFALSWGFRARNMTLRGAPEVLASAGGPIAFIAATTILLSGQANLARRLCELTNRDSWRRSSVNLAHSFDAIAQRNQSLLKYALPLQSLLVESKVATTFDIETMNSILGSLGSRTDMVLQVIEAIDEETLALATSAARDPDG